MLPPSVTDAADALSVNVVASASSVTVVLTVAVVSSASKLPPADALMPTLSVSVPWV